MRTAIFSALAVGILVIALVVNASKPDEGRWVKACSTPEIHGDRATSVCEYQREK